jgi:Remorin, C-terminal region
VCVCVFFLNLSRYQREEAKIQAWVNLESAKAEAQSRKLEVQHSIILFTFL